jgi:hypothetical protein
MCRAFRTSRERVFVWRAPARLNGRRASVQTHAPLRRCRPSTAEWRFGVTEGGSLLHHVWTAPRMQEEK